MSVMEREETETATRPLNVLFFGDNIAWIRGMASCIRKSCRNVGQLIWVSEAGTIDEVLYHTPIDAVFLCDVVDEQVTPEEVAAYIQAFRELWERNMRVIYVVGTYGAPHEKAQQAEELNGLVEVVVTCWDELDKVATLVEGIQCNHPEEETLVFDGLAHCLSEDLVLLS